MTENKDSFRKKRRSYKNKNMKKSMYLQDCFHLAYAGKADIFISFNDLKKKYELIISGVHIVEDVYAFTSRYSKHYYFDSLYNAIKAFNLVLNILTSTTDWYNPDMFDSRYIYDEIKVGVD